MTVRASSRSNRTRRQRAETGRRRSSQEGEGLDEQIAGTERELQKVQFEEDRAIRLYVSEKITEEQLDRQRKFITERLETLRARLADYRSKETASMEKRALGEHVVEWANRVGDGLDDLPQEKRRDVLRLLLDEVTIDGENNVSLTLAVDCGGRLPGVEVPHP